MPRWKKKVVSEVPASELETPAVDNQKLSQKEPSALEKAMEMLIMSNASTQQLLGKISETMDKVAEGIEKINLDTKNAVDHQVDLDQMNKSKPFKIQIIYQVDQKTIDLGDGIFEYENTWRAFNTRSEASDFWMTNFWSGRFRIVEVEKYISQE